jgi:hypothetical protein
MSLRDPRLPPGTADRRRSRAASGVGPRAASLKARPGTAEGGVKHRVGGRILRGRAGTHNLSKVASGPRVLAEASHARYPAPCLPQKSLDHTSAYFRNRISAWIHKA